MGRLGGLFLKYLEELTFAETFKLEDQYWFLTCDFRNNGQKLCYNMNDGYAKWFDGSIMVEVAPIYALDKDNNILPIKHYKNENNNIS